MLFHSPEFLFGFLPVALAGFFLFARMGARAALAWLALASSFFYGWWNPVYLPLLLGSLCANFCLGRRIAAAESPTHAGRWLAAGVTLNLLLLGIFKYLGFFIRTANDWTGARFPVPEIVLPLGISFYTFTQIAYLVDTRNGRGTRTGPLGYGLFIIFFPHCIAGPIVHHHQLIPQFDRREMFRFCAGAFSVGLTLFVIGLAKKVILADTIARFARPVFADAAAGGIPGFFEAWTGALSYTLQLYFDFSGYSDMALGLARMFNVKFPVNFNAPYKATSIIEFWRRWHMTLSAFLRNYLYIPLGGSRCGSVRHYSNLFLTMLLGGLWHGAGWTFVVWGAWHGACLCANNLFRAMRGAGGDHTASPAWARLAGGALTFLCVVIGWVFFKAASLHAAMCMLRGMFSVPTLPDAGLSAMASPFAWIAALLAIVWFAPTSQSFLAQHGPALHDVPGSRLKWHASAPWALAIALLFTVAILHLSQISEFIYFQF